MNLFKKIPGWAFVLIALSIIAGVGLIIGIVNKANAPPDKLDSIVVKAPSGIDELGFVYILNIDPRNINDTNFKTSFVWGDILKDGASKTLSTNELGSLSQVWIMITGDGSWTISVNNHDYTLNITPPTFDTYKVTASGIDDEGQIWPSGSETTTQQGTAQAQTQQNSTPPAQISVRDTTGTATTLGAGSFTGGKDVAGR